MTRVAAVDVGTNSVRLMVADPGAPLDVVERATRITRLGLDVDRTGRLDDDALARTLDCIGEYARRWRALGAERVRVTATSAVRDAADRDRFFHGVREIAGVDAEVLTGEQEAHAAFRGATSAVAGDPPYLVLDIGGGSTEFIRGGERPVAACSRQLGCVRLSERCLRSDPPTTTQLAAALRVVDEHLDAVTPLVCPADAQTLIGVAGTVTTVAALALGLDCYEPARIHASRITLDDVATVTGQLAAMTVAQRAALGPMAPGREDVIVAGALILQRVMARYGFGEVLVSEADILDGLALGLVGPD